MQELERYGVFLLKDKEFLKLVATENSKPAGFC